VEEAAVFSLSYQLEIFLRRGKHQKLEQKVVYHGTPYTI